MGSGVSIQNTHLKKGLAGDGLISERSNRYIRNHMYNHPGRKLSVFVSHTHGDNDVELEILHQEIYPILKQDALYYGIDISIVDLYQGLEDIRTIDHSILQNHIYAVKKCFFESRGIPDLQHLPLYFISLQSERYGLIPLPRLVYEKDFKAVISAPSLTRQHRECMNKWYVVDDNSIPPVYVLQPLATKDDDSFWKDDYYLLLTAFEHTERASEGQTLNQSRSKFSVGQSISEYGTRVALYMSNMTRNRYTNEADGEQASGDKLGLHWWYRCFCKNAYEAIDKDEDLYTEDREQVVIPYADKKQERQVMVESTYESGYKATSVDVDGTLTTMNHNTSGDQTFRADRESAQGYHRQLDTEDELCEAYLQILPYNNCGAFGVQKHNTHVHTSASRVHLPHYLLPGVSAKRDFKLHRSIKAYIKRNTTGSGHIKTELLQRQERKAEEEDGIAEAVRDGLLVFSDVYVSSTGKSNIISTDPVQERRLSDYKKLLLHNLHRDNVTLYKNRKLDMLSFMSEYVHQDHTPHHHDYHNVNHTLEKLDGKESSEEVDADIKEGDRSITKDNVDAQVEAETPYEQYLNGYATHMYRLLSDQLHSLSHISQQWQYHACSLHLPGYYIDEMHSHHGSSQFYLSNYQPLPVYESLLLSCMKRLYDANRSYINQWDSISNMELDCISLAIVATENGHGRSTFLTRLLQKCKERDVVEGIDRPYILKYVNSSNMSRDSRTLMRSICMQIHFYYKIDRDNVDDRYGLGRIPLGYHSANTGLGAGVERGDHGGILGTDNAQQSSYCQNNGSDTYDRLKDYFGELLAEYPVVLMLDDVDCLGLKTELGVACYDTQSEGNEKHYMGSVHSGVGSAYGEHELTFLTDIKTHADTRIIISALDRKDDVGQRNASHDTLRTIPDLPLPRHHIVNHLSTSKVPLAYLGPLVAGGEALGGDDNKEGVDEYDSASTTSISKSDYTGSEMDLESIKFLLKAICKKRRRKLSREQSAEFYKSLAQVQSQNLSITLVTTMCYIASNWTSHLRLSDALDTIHIVPTPRNDTPSTGGKSGNSTVVDVDKKSAHLSLLQPYEQLLEHHLIELEKGFGKTFTCALLSLITAATNRTSGSDNGSGGSQGGQCKRVFSSVYDLTDAEMALVLSPRQNKGAMGDELDPSLQKLQQTCMAECRTYSGLTAHINTIPVWLILKFRQSLEAFHLLRVKTVSSYGDSYRHKDAHIHHEGEEIADHWNLNRSVHDETLLLWLNDTITTAMTKRLSLEMKRDAYALLGYHYLHQPLILERFEDMIHDQEKHAEHIAGDEGAEGSDADGWTHPESHIWNNHCVVNRGKIEHGVYFLLQAHHYHNLVQLSPVQSSSSQKGRAYAMKPVTSSIYLQSAYLELCNLDVCMAHIKIGWALVYLQRLYTLRDAYMDIHCERPISSAGGSGSVESNTTKNSGGSAGSVAPLDRSLFSWLSTATALQEDGNNIGNSKAADSIQGSDGDNLVMLTICSYLHWYSSLMSELAADKDRSKMLRSLLDDTAPSPIKGYYHEEHGHDDVDDEEEKGGDEDEDEDEGYITSDDEEDINRAALHAYDGIGISAVGVYQLSLPARLLQMFITSIIRLQPCISILPSHFMYRADCQLSLCSGMNNKYVEDSHPVRLSRVKWPHPLYFAKMKRRGKHKRRKGKQKKAGKGKKKKGNKSHKGQRDNMVEKKSGGEKAPDQKPIKRKDLAAHSKHALTHLHNHGGVPTRVLPLPVVHNLDILKMKKYWASLLLGVSAGSVSHRLIKYKEKTDGDDNEDSDVEEEEEEEEGSEDGEAESKEKEQEKEKGKEKEKDIVANIDDVSTAIDLSHLEVHASHSLSYWDGARPLTFSPLLYSLSLPTTALTNSSQQANNHTTQGGIITALGVSHCGQYFISGDNCGRIMTWTLRTRAVHRVRRGHSGEGVKCIALNHSETLIATGGNDSNIFIWSNVDFKRDPDPVSAAPASNDEVRIKSSHDDIVGQDAAYLYHPHHHAHSCHIPLRILTGHTGAITSVSFMRNRDDSRVLSSSTDKTIRMWHTGLTHFVGHNVNLEGTTHGHHDTSDMKGAMGDSKGAIGGMNRTFKSTTTSVHKLNTTDIDDHGNTYDYSDTDYMEIEESIKHNLAGVRTLGYEHVHDTSLITLSTLEKALKLKLKVMEQNRLRQEAEEADKEHEESRLMMHNGIKTERNSEEKGDCRPSSPSLRRTLHVQGTGRRACPVSPTSSIIHHAGSRLADSVQGGRPSNLLNKVDMRNISHMSGDASTKKSRGSRSSPRKKTPTPSTPSREMSDPGTEGRVPSLDLISTSRNLPELLEKLTREADLVEQHKSEIEHDIQDAPVLLFKLEGHTKAVSHACFSYNNEEIFSCGFDGMIYIWNSNGDEIDPIYALHAHAYRITSMSLSLSGTVLVTSAADGCIRTWDIERDDVEHPSLELVSMKGGYMASTVQCSATGDIVVAGDSAGNVTFWSGQGSVGTAQTSQAPLPTGTSRLKRNNKGKLSERIMRKIASAPITSYPVGNVSCYGEASVSSMHMHPSGEYMIVAYTDRTINVYDCPAIYTPTVDNNTGGGRTVKRPSSAKVFQRRNSHVQNASSASLFARGKSGSTGSGGGTDIPESVMSLLLQIEAYNVKHGGGLKYIPFDPNSTIDSDDGEDGEEKGQKPKGVVSLGGNGSVTVNKLANKGDRVILIMDVE